MRLILIILFSWCLSVSAQVIRANSYYVANASAPSYSYLLDTYTSSNVAYSMFKLRSAYSGNCIKVRRSNDNTEQDIGFVNNELDTASLKSFVGSNSGYVTTWYDQSTNGWNATQTTAANQPRIVNAGVVDRKGGKPSIFFSSAGPNGMKVVITSGTITTHSVFVVVCPTSAIGNARIVSTRKTGASFDYLDYIPVIDDGSVSLGSYVGGIVAIRTVSRTNLNLYNNFETGSQVKNSINGGTEATSSYTLNMTIATYTIGMSDFSSGVNNNGNTNGYISEVVIYNADKSSDRTGINSNINTRFSIY